MGQKIAVDPSIFADARNKVVDAASSVGIPDWLSALVVPDATVEPSDFMSPLGAAAGRGKSLFQTLMNRLKGKGGKPSVAQGLNTAGIPDASVSPATKASLPAEFQAPGLEQEAYNTLRKSQEAWRKPATVEDPVLVRKQTGVMEDPLRAARERAKAEGRPELPRTSREPRDVRGSALKDGPKSLDKYMREDLDNLTENSLYNSNHYTSSRNRFGEDYLDVDPNQQTFAGADEFGEPTSEEGLDFMRDFNNLQATDTARLSSLENLFTRHNRDVVSNRNNMGLDPLGHGKPSTPQQRRLSFGSGAPLFSADSSIPPYEANPVIGMFNRAFDTIKGQQTKFPDLQPSDLVKRVNITPGFGGMHRGSQRTIDVGIDGAKHTTAHELQHAYDDSFTPGMFDDYPAYPQGAFDVDMPAAYWTHPTEVRARAAGSVSNLIEDGLETGQQALPGDFLTEFATGLETIEGRNKAANKNLRDLQTANRRNRYKAGQADPYFRPEQPYTWNRDLPFPEDEAVAQTPFNPKSSLFQEASKRQGVIPQYRDKAGMLVDVLEELKNAPGNSFDTTDDPVRYVAGLKSVDDSAVGRPKVEKAAAARMLEEMFGRELPPPTQPHMINDLTQDLSDYFAGPKFDPFGSERGPLPEDTMRWMVDDVHEGFKPKGGLADDQDMSWAVRAYGNTPPKIGQPPTQLGPGHTRFDNVDDFDTKYVVIDADGKAVGGMGDGEYARELYPESDGFRVVENPKWQGLQGNGSAGMYGQFASWLEKKMNMTEEHFRKLPQEAKENILNRFDDDMHGIGG